MRIHPAQQGTQAWLESRAGIPTASEFGQLMTSKFEPRKGEMPATYLAKKLAERWGGPMPAHSSWAMEQGNILEEVAIPWYEFQFGQRIDRVGLMTTDDGRVGCSPDGVIDGKIGVEIKCPEATNHVKYVMSGVVPDDYLCQVHGSIYVSGFSAWKFVSFRKCFPPLVVNVDRHEESCKKIHDVITEFLERFDRAWFFLKELNGGPPPPREPMVFAGFGSDRLDVKNLN